MRPAIHRRITPPGYQMLNNCPLLVRLRRGKKGEQSRLARLVLSDSMRKGKGILEEFLGFLNPKALIEWLGRGQVVYRPERDLCKSKSPYLPTTLSIRREVTRHQAYKTSSSKN